ncbi:hypothetical protein ACF0H5_018911 [Mactra antiquata]
MASNEMMEIIGNDGSSSTQTPIHGYTFETETVSAVNIADLKPILMMANMANVSQEVQVSSQLPVAQNMEVNLSDSDIQSYNTPKAGSSRSYSSEIYPDSDSGVTYEVIHGGTNRGRDKLIDSLGFTYNLKQGRGGKDVTYWWCAVRNTHLRCPASVCQKGTTFTRGKRKHEHLVGQSTPKPLSTPGSNRRTPVGRPSGSSNSRMNESVDKNKPSFANYKIIKEGSKAGKDLLRDRFGYTYTQKKVSQGGYLVTWRCSIRNSMCCCRSIVIQEGHSFRPGKYDHLHLPGHNRTVTDLDVIPKMSQIGKYGDDDFSDNDESFDTDTYHSYTKSNSKYGGFTGSTPMKKVTPTQRMFAKESKRKDHPTFLGPSCTINLTKCDDRECNCKMVHCPFCDPSHFIPAKAGRVQDHLELTHFAHGVQYDDLMIVKCFQDCNLERNFGHYHCVFCSQQILKRNSYARHMLRHMRRLGIPDRLLVLPDSKYPDVINAYGYEIPICKKVSCHPSRDKHYHCPQCTQVCKERSLTVNHLWRCLQRKEKTTDPLSDEEEMQNTVDESQLILHYSHVRNFKDLPLERCPLPSCCNQMYHCRLCPPTLFRPSYKQHLIAHYITHWKQRVPYKGYALLKCFQYCDGIDRSFLKSKFHFHCPICCKIILTKGSFEDHIKGCHMFKFGENLIEESVDELDVTMEEDIVSVQDSVEYMEDRLTAQAIALEEEKLMKRASLPMSEKRVPQYGGKFRAPRISTDLNRLVKTIKKEITDAMGQETNEYEDENTSEDLADDVYGLNINRNEIYELASVLLSEKFVDSLKSAGVLNSVLGKVTGLTNTRMIQEDDRYLLSGKLEDLNNVKKLLLRAINGEDEDSESEEEEDSPKKVVKKAAAVPKKKQKISKDQKDDKSNIKKGKGKGKATTEVATKKKGKVVEETPKRGRGRPKKKSDSFPYSEIKEIIEASRKTDTAGKKGRGRPSKKLPAPAKASTSKTTAVTKTEPPRTPGRYGTRGVKRDYLQMNSGNLATVIKQEVVSESEKEDGDDDDDDDDDNEEDNVEEEEEDDDGDGNDDNEEDSGDEIGEKENLDDSEQELDEITSDVEKEMNDKEDKNDGLSPTNKIIVLSPTKSSESGNKITDSAIKRLKTSNVSTSVPLISKVGIRHVACGKRKPKAKKSDNDVDDNVTALKECSLKCSICEDYTAPSFADLTTHLRTVHRVHDPPRCDICEQDLDNTQALQSHIEKKHGPAFTPFSCEYDGCTKSFNTSASLSSHVSLVHLHNKKLPRGGKRYSCGKCNFKTNSIEDLYEHKKVQHDEEIRCEPCNKTFSSHQTFKYHNELKHSDSLPHSCNICEKQFSSKQYLQRHMNFHNAKFSCKICNKFVSSKTSLMYHMETHKPEEERNYKHVCSYCGKKYFLRTNFEDHLNKHTGNRPHKCDLCNKSFGFRSMLKKHKKFVHTSDRPFKCGFCMKGFKFMNLLKNHVTVHTNRSKHVCPSCNKCFSTATTLKYHRQKCGMTTTIGFTNVLPDNVVLKQVNDMTETMQVLDSNIIGNTVTVNEQNVGMAMEIIQSGGGLSLGMSSNVVEEPQTVAPPSEPVQASEVEVYACSECKATFNTFKEAEVHVLTAHSQGSGSA